MKVIYLEKTTIQEENKEDNFYIALIQKAKVGTIDISDLKIKLQKSNEQKVPISLTDKDYRLINSILNSREVIAQKWGIRCCSYCGGLLADSKTYFEITKHTKENQSEGYNGVGDITRKLIGKVCDKCISENLQ